MALLSSRLSIRLSRGVARLRARYDPPAEVEVGLREIDYEVPGNLDELLALEDGASETFLVRNAGSGTARTVSFSPRSTIASRKKATFRPVGLPIPELTAGDGVLVSGRWSSGRCRPPYFVEVRWEDSRGAQVRTQHVSLPE